MSQLTTSKLRYRYRGNRQWTLSGVSTAIDAGEFVLLLGPSGSGKSTIARCFNGLIPHSLPGELEGQVEICGRDVTDASQATLAKQVGLVFQNPDLQFVTSTVETEIAFGLENLSVPSYEISTRIDDVLDTVGLSGFESRRIERLSGGEKQRLAIACQLAMEPKILVLDEPTANLDSHGTESVYQLLRELAQDDSRTIVLIEHQCESLIDVVDRTLVLDGGGSLLLEGTPETVFAEHPRRLQDEGVWIPAVTTLALELRSTGYWPDSTPLPVTVEGAVEPLGELVSERQSSQPRTSSPQPDGGDQPERSPDRQGGTVDHSDRTNEPEMGDDRTTPPALDIHGLDAEYGSDGGADPVLNDVELSVPEESFLAVVGPNGAGKSTLAKHCVGVLSPPQETVFVGGRDVTTIPSKEISRHVGYVFQNPEAQFVTDSVQEELAYGLRQLGFDADEIERRTEQALERFDLTDHAETNPFTLSHGEKRRLSVATMLVVGQQVLVVDEPTYGQDRANADALMETLSELHDSGRTVVVLTHDMRIVAEYADRVAVLVDGKIQFHGTPSELFADPQTLSAAQLSRPPLAELTDQFPAWSGVATVDRCYEHCTGGRTETTSQDPDTHSSPTIDSGEEW